uniref:Uncharacterized protein n=1 Tax=Physcomitrium patens TaxID=3218 RepID=A0A2K1L8I0_PHYPA|nr:hypothetical protein PHYPA_000728 [Physcomitrium patens]
MLQFLRRRLWNTLINELIKEEIITRVQDMHVCEHETRTGLLCRFQRIDKSRLEYAECNRSKSFPWYIYLKEVGTQLCDHWDNRIFPSSSKPLPKLKTVRFCMDRGPRKQYA